MGHNGREVTSLLADKLAEVKKKIVATKEGGAITGEERYTALARAALKTLRRRLVPQKRLKTVQCLGGFAGWGGVLYTLAQLGALWHGPEIFAEAERRQVRFAAHFGPFIA